MTCKNSRVTMYLSDNPATNRPDYAALYLVAEGQRGYFTTRHARQVGISDRLLTHWVRNGRFHRVAHGIYRLRDFPVTPREELTIPLLWAGPNSALSYETALELYGIAGVLPTTTHLTVPVSFTPRPHPGVRVHRDPLSPHEIVVRDDLRLTTVERTLVDCFRWGTDRDQLVIAAHQAVDRGLVTARTLSAALNQAAITADFEAGIPTVSAG